MSRNEGEAFVFRHCPRCGRAGIRSENHRRWHCDECGFEYFHNVATAAGVFVSGPEGILLIERARDPGLGLYCLPGGFVEPGEGVEEAARRECREELGWEAGELDFLFSFPNVYNYNEVPYDTCDVYFIAKIDALEIGLFEPNPAECASILIASAEDIKPASIAFDSARRAISAFIDGERR